MVPTRRLALSLLAVPLAGPACAQPAASWFDLRSDGGGQVPNLRLPAELVNEIEDLPGILWAGAKTPAQTVYGFYDYNCPWCRAGAEDLHALLDGTPGLRLGLVGNPVLSPGSAAAARVGLAAASVLGPERAYDYHRRLLAVRGPVDGPRALALAAELGADHALVATRAESEPAKAAVARGMRLAASLGLAATPSFVLGTAGILGYPGPRALGRMVAALEACDRPAC